MRELGFNKGMGGSMPFFTPLGAQIMQLLGIFSIVVGACFTRTFKQNKLFVLQI